MSIQLWCLFVAALLHLITKMPLFQEQNAISGGYDNHDPRSQRAALQGRGRRALAAHENQIESFPLFAAGVLVSTVTGMTSAIASYLAIAFLASRLTYFYLYLRDVPALRSPVWAIGYLCSLALLCSPAWAVS